MSLEQFALNPFQKKGKVESEKKIEVERDPLLEKVLEQYNNLEENKDYNFSETKNYISSLENIILKPAKINLFLQNIIHKDLIKGTKYESSDITGLYISKLIQDSYNAGNNDFVLDTKDNEINYFGFRLKGKENNKLNVTINGNTGHNCGYLSKHSNFTINGNTGHNCGYFSEHSNFTINGNTEDLCGYESQDSNFTINGNTGLNCGEYSQYSNFTINGNTGEECGSGSKQSNFTINGNTEDLCGYESQDSNFTINGNTGRGCGYESRNSKFTIHGHIGDNCGEDSKHSIYQTTNKNTYERMLKDVPTKNKVVLLDDKGLIIEGVSK